MIEEKVAIIGGGIVGCAVAYELSLFTNVFLFEKEPFLFAHSSSRNSGVVHSGLYYPGNSLKKRLCIEGNKLLYDFCERHKIKYKKDGKLIVAVTEADEKELEKLFENGLNNNVPLSKLSREEVKKLEPYIEARSALFSPTSGIVDVAELVNALERECSKRGVVILRNSKIKNISKENDEVKLETEERGSDNFNFVINATGLFADEIYTMITKSRKHKIIPYRGEYFEIKGKKAALVSRPVYPVPSDTFLGIHLTPTFEDKLLVGPSSRKIEEKTDYTRDKLPALLFYEAIKPYFPAVEISDLEEGFSGIRSKLSINDFLIEENPENVFHLLGIDSPGLTSCFAIAEEISKRLK